MRGGGFKRGKQEPGAAQVGGLSAVCGRDFAVTAVSSASKLANTPWQPATGKMNSPLVSFFSCLPSAHPPGTQLDAPTPPIPLPCPTMFPQRAAALSISSRGSRGLAQNPLISCRCGAAWHQVAEQGVHGMGAGGLLHPPFPGQPTWDLPNFL